MSPAGRRPLGFRVFRGADGVAGAVGPNVVAFGKFDGLHLGHRALLHRAAGASGRLGLPYGAVTFERHPDAFLRRGPVPGMLTGLGEKLRLLRDAGVHFVVLLPVDASVLGMPAEQFTHEVLHTRMEVRVVVVGQNFRFGQRGGGGVLTLRELSSVEGLDGVEVGTVQVAGAPVSATRIRASLAHGDVELARDLLGRPYEVTGILRILSPTQAAVAVAAARAVPCAGKYLGSFRLGSNPATAAAVEVCENDGGRQRLIVLHDETGLVGRKPTGRARVVFDKRL